MQAGICYDSPHVFVFHFCISLCVKHYRKAQRYFIPCPSLRFFAPVLPVAPYASWNVPLQPSNGANLRLAAAPAATLHPQPCLLA